MPLNGKSGGKGAVPDQDRKVVGMCRKIKLAGMGKGNQEYQLVGQVQVRRHDTKDP